MSKQATENASGSDNLNLLVSLQRGDNNDGLDFSKMSAGEIFERVDECRAIEAEKHKELKAMHKRYLEAQEQANDKHEPRGSKE